MKAITWIVLTLCSISASAQNVSTFAGMAGVVGSNNGQAATASFNNPHGVASDLQGNVYVADRYGHKIRKITPAGIVSTFAGSSSPGFNNGPGATASFNEPWSLACDNAGNVYVADAKNYAIRKITPLGIVSTVAGTGSFGVTNGPVSTAQFGFPSGVAVSPNGAKVYVCDRMTHTIREISGGNVITLAGTAFSAGSIDGSGAAARFDHPYSIALDIQGNVFVADEWNNKVRRVSPSGVVTTFAGSGMPGSTNGSAASASFNGPWGITTSPNGDIYVSEGNNFLIRKITPAGIVSTFAGQDGIPGFANGPVLQATFNGVSSIWNDVNSGTIYLCDPYSQLVRQIAAAGPPPLVISSNSPNNTICSGGSITIQATPSNLNSYSFFDGATLLGTNSTGTITINNFIQGAHNITCTGVNSQGQSSNSNTLIVTVLAPLSVSITTNGPTTICPGDSTELTASQGAIYNWSNGATTQNIFAAAAGTFTVTVTDVNGCSGSSPAVQISDLQAPTANITQSPSNAVCVGDTVTLTASTANGWQWSTGATSQAIVVTNPGNYTVLVTNNAGCSAISAPSNITFLPQNNSSITPSGTILITPGTSVNFTANQGISYQWSNSNTTQSIAVSSAGIYTVTVTDANGCSSIPASVTVTIQDPSTMALALGATSFCEGDSVELASSFLSGNQWFRNGSAVLGATQQTFYAKTTGTYFLRVTQTNGGPDLYSDSINITTTVLPSTIATTEDSVCRGELAQLTVDQQLGLNYTWYDQITGGSVVNTGTTFTTPGITGTASWYIELSDLNGCIKPDRFIISAYELPTPTADFSAGAANPVSGGFEVNFTDNSTSTTVWSWEFGDPNSTNNTSALQSPSHLYNTVGDYIVRLITTNNNGCSDTILRTISVNRSNNTFIPSAFTPNNDGNNDLFRVRGNNISHYDMSIYSSWGQRIFHSPKEYTGWNGIANGSLVPNGTYAYVIEVTFENGDQELYKGNISVIR